MEISKQNIATDEIIQILKTFQNKLQTIKLKTLSGKFYDLILNIDTVIKFVGKEKQMPYSEFIKLNETIGKLCAHVSELGNIEINNAINDYLTKPFNNLKVNVHGNLNQSNSELVYYQKYLKYKNKYLQFKNKISE